MFTDYQVERYRRERNAVFVDIYSAILESNIEMRFSFKSIDAACKFEYDIKERCRCNMRFRLQSIIELYKWYFMGG